MGASKNGPAAEAGTQVQKTAEQEQQRDEAVAEREQQRHCGEPDVTGAMGRRLVMLLALWALPPRFTALLDE